MTRSTIDPHEIAHFSKDSSQWWDEDGPFAPLHRLNPTRITYLKDQITTHFANHFKGIKGLSILDIGCGGGLVSEPLARLGANMTSIDGDANAITTAKAHAEQNDLKINYLNGDANNLIQDKKRFDVVLALEIIEHVSDPNAFIDTLTNLVRPNGLIIISTLNRTPKSYALGIVAAEYILKWVPRGTHTWSKFLKPSEISKMLQCHNFKPQNITGMNFNPVTNGFELSKHDLSVNYFLTATKAD